MENLKLKTSEFTSTAKLLIDKYATDCFALFRSGGRNGFFQKKYLMKIRVQIVHNGIDINRFLFNNSIREKIRTQLSLGNSFTIINTGRFTEQKESEFYIRYC